MRSRQAKLQEDTYFRVMRILQENPDLIQYKRAEKTGEDQADGLRKQAQ